MLIGVPMGNNTLIGLIINKFTCWQKKLLESDFYPIYASIGEKNDPVLNKKILDYFRTIGYLKKGFKKYKGKSREEICNEFKKNLRMLVSSVTSERRSVNDIASEIVNKIGSIPATKHTFNKDVYNGIPIRKDILLAACEGQTDIKELIEKRRKHPHITTNYSDPSSFNLGIRKIQLVSIYKKNFLSNDEASSVLGDGAKKGLYAGFKVIVDGTDTRPSDRVFWHVTVAAPSGCDKFVGKLAEIPDVKHNHVSFNGTFSAQECLLDKRSSMPSAGKKTTVIGICAPIACGKSSVISEIANILRNSGKTVEVISTDEINKQAYLTGKRVSAYSVIESVSYSCDKDYLMVDTGFTNGTKPNWVDKMFILTTTNVLDMLLYSLTGVTLRDDHPTIKLPDKLKAIINKLKV